MHSPSSMKEHVTGAFTDPGSQDLARIFELKYGPPATARWGPRMRRWFGYSNPDDLYEAHVEKLIRPGSRWLDVGCGRMLFPSNPALARELADRCGRLVGVDPDRTLQENPFVHEKVHLPIEDFRTDEPFDLVTLRMVVEHISDPARAVAAIAGALRPGGRVVVYTVFKYSPVPIVTKAVPHGLHHPIKKFLWRTESKDTFPVVYRLNTRGALRAHFEAAGCREIRFRYLDDCRSLARFRVTQFLELAAYRALRLFGLHYPEVCLLGIYEKT